MGRTTDLAELARTAFVDEVILAAPHDRELTLRVLRAAQQLRLDVKMAPDLFGCEPMRETERIGDMPLISLHEEPLPVAGLLLKRVLDVVGAGLALILLGPVLAVLGDSCPIGFAGAGALCGAARGTQGQSRFAATSFAPW